LTDRTRNEPRDLYDVWYLTAKQNLDLSVLTQELTTKLEFRGRVLADVGNEFVNKEDRLKKLWEARLANQIAALPHYVEVYRSVRRSLRKADLMSV